MSGIDLSALQRDPLLPVLWHHLGTPRCHATGGYVRDRLLGRHSTDVDLVAPGSIDDVAAGVRRLAKHLGGSAHVLGKGDRRIWRIDAEQQIVEVWPLGNLSVDDDIARRDFTCNAFVWHLPSGPLDDRLHALNDLRTRTLRGIASRNFDDDPVRLIRAARFVAQLTGFEIEPRTAGWLRALAPRAARAPKERVGQELLKTVRARGARRGLDVLLNSGLLAAVAPAATCDAVWLRRHLEAASRLTGALPHPLRTAAQNAGEAAPLALLLRAWGAPNDDAVEAYAWHRRLRRHAVQAAALLESTIDAAAAPSPTERRSIIADAGRGFPATIALAAAVEVDRNWRRWWRMWRRTGARLVDPSPLLDGHEIASILSLEPGPELGAASTALIRAQIRNVVRSRGGAKRWLTTKWAANRRSGA
jgi:poly(A) polymerase